MFILYSSASFNSENITKPVHNVFTALAKSKSCLSDKIRYKYGPSSWMWCSQMRDCPFGDDRRNWGYHKPVCTIFRIKIFAFMLISCNWHWIKASKSRSTQYIRWLDIGNAWIKSWFFEQHSFDKGSFTWLGT